MMRVTTISILLLSISGSLAIGGDQSDANGYENLLDPVRLVVTDRLLPKTPYFWIEKFYEQGKPATMNDIPEVDRDGALKIDETPWTIINLVGAEMKDDDLSEFPYMLVRGKVTRTHTITFFGRPVMKTTITSNVVRYCREDVPCVFENVPIPMIQQTPTDLVITIAANDDKQVTYYRRVGDLLVLKVQKYSGKSKKAETFYSYGWKE